MAANWAGHPAILIGTRLRKLFHHELHFRVGGRSVRFWAYGGTKFPKMEDYLPRTPINDRAKFDTARFILVREICNRTTHKQKNSNRYIHIPHLAHRHVWIINTPIYLQQHTVVMSVMWLTSHDIYRYHVPMQIVNNIENVFACKSPSYQQLYWTWLFCYFFIANGCIYYLFHNGFLPIPFNFKVEKLFWLCLCVCVCVHL